MTREQFLAMNQCLLPIKMLDGRVGVAPHWTDIEILADVYDEAGTMTEMRVPYERVRAQGMALLEVSQGYVDHLTQVRERALAELDAGSPSETAIASVLSDLAKHPETRLLLTTAFYCESIVAAVADTAAVRVWIGEIQ